MGGVFLVGTLGYISGLTEDERKSSAAYKEANMQHRACFLLPSEKSYLWMQTEQIMLDLLCMLGLCHGSHLEWVDGGGGLGADLNKAGGPGLPTLKNEAPATTFYKIEALEWLLGP